MTLGALAARLGVELRGQAAVQIQGVATLERAVPGTLSFLSHKKYRKHLVHTQASAVILTAADVAACPVAALVSADPHLTYAHAARCLYPPAAVVAGVHPQAVVEPGAQLDPSAWIGPLSWIGAGVQIGPRTYIGPGCVVEANCVLGADCRLVARVTLCHRTVLGQRVLVHPGAVLGSEGFGFARDHERWLRIPQIGRVCVGDDVEIGANTTVDRGALEDTVIANGAILDNQIQIGHNVTIGEGTAIAACTGISGSTHIGRHCLLGGDVGIAGHLHIGDGVVLAAGSRVSRDLSGPGHYGGVLPVEPDPQWRRTIARVRQLDDLAHRLIRLERICARADPSHSE